MSDEETEKRLFSALLERWQSGDDAARNQIVALIHRELEHVAAVVLRRNRAPRSMVTGDLVNEAILRLLQSPDLKVNNRPHLLALCARIMRFVLVDASRSKIAQKRHGDMVTLTTAAGATPGPDFEALALERALVRLQGFDPVRAQIVEMRYFGGMTVRDIGQVLNTSPATVKRSWQVARVWLQEALEQGVG